MKRTNDNYEENSGYFFWGVGRGGNLSDLWDSLHAHFEKQARKDDGRVEESYEQGRSAK